MHQRILPLFETSLKQKYHSAKLQQISRRKHSSHLKESHRHNSRSILQNQLEKKIALGNLELVKRLAEVRYRPAEVRKHWEGPRSQEKRASVKLHRNILQERQRLAQNERLGRSIQRISMRKKRLILPE